MAFDKYKRRQRIKSGIRRKISGTAQKPRLSVFKSNKGIYAQLIDDLKGHTLTTSNSLELGSDKVNVEVCQNVGKKLAEKATSEGIKEVVFDRSGYLYHGKIKALAEGAREGGLKF